MDVDDTLTEQVADAIRSRLALRRRRGLVPSSGKELATMTGMSQSGISARLTGATPIDLNELDAIARALGVEVVELLPLDDQPAERVLTRRRRLTGSYPIATAAATPTQPDSHHIRPSARPAGSPRSMSRVPAPTTASISRPARLSHPPAPAPHNATSR
jgi:transcriptional regulator with XRE-family HTH domain